MRRQGASTMARGRRPQQGVAAIEFAFVFGILFALLYGVATFGAALYTQQVVSRAASDGARASAVFTAVAANDPRVQRVVYESLASSLIAPPGVNDTPAQRLAWLQSRVALPEVNTSNPAQVTVRVVYPYRDNPVLLALPLTSAWLPTSLVGSATAVRLTGG